MIHFTFQRSGLTAAVLLTVLVLIGGSAVAQDDDCAAQADAALRQLALNCANLGSNEACYGWSEVTAVFGPGASGGSDTFSRPADRASLLGVQSLESSAFNLGDESWGIAVLTVQGNLPLTLTPPGLVYMMVGDVTLTNGVSADMMLRALVKPLAVTLSEGLDAYAAPGDDAPVAQLATGTILQIDGVTPDGQWLRIAYQTEDGSPFAWVKADAVWERQTSLEAPGVAVRGLPEIEPRTRGPMQTFFLRTGIEAPACAAVPPALLYVQTPDGVAVDITVNGVSLRVEGVVILRLVPDGSAPSGLALRVFVPSGLTVLYAGTDSAILLPPAFAVQAPLEFDQNGNLLISDAFTAIAPVGGAELDALQGLEALPENLLNFPAFIPTVITPSGVGQPNPVFAFDDPVLALARTRALCSAGALADDVCAILLAAVGG
jgi:hypothetical protein